MNYEGEAQLGNRPMTPGRTVIGASVGPMARELDAVTAVMRVLLDTDWDVVDKYVVPIKWTPVQVKHTIEHIVQSVCSRANCALAGMTTMGISCPCRPVVGRCVRHAMH